MTTYIKISIRELISRIKYLQHRSSKVSDVMNLIESAKLGKFNIPRIINGMWQVAGGHGAITPKYAISEMNDYHSMGLVAWDMADIYGPAEEFYGKFRNDLGTEQREESTAFTKFVPNPGPMTKSIVEYHINESIKRMGVDSIDLLQFHWWDYNDSSYLDALHSLETLCDDGKITHLALTNFDTRRIQIMSDEGIKIISNQVQYSILDCRPRVKMGPFCEKLGIKLLTYGTLLGGFFSEKYLGHREPEHSTLDTHSLQKYKNMIDVWGGWSLFQELLSVLNSIAKKHESSIANVAVRYVLDSPAVAGVIIGTRLGIADHREDNCRVFSLKLDSDDHSKIKEITSRANDLYSVIGDCGSEYR